MEPNNSEIVSLFVTVISGVILGIDGCDRITPPFLQVHLRRVRKPVIDDLVYKPRTLYYDLSIKIKLRAREKNSSNQ
jgi:hypothetical protein